MAARAFVTGGAGFAGRHLMAVLGQDAAAPSREELDLLDAGALRQAVASSMGFAFVGADNGSITHLVISPERWFVRRFNDTAHLPGGLDFDLS